MDDKKQFSVRLNAAINEAIAEYREMLEENGEILNTDKKILESLVDTALSKFRPYKENNQRIKELEKINENLVIENETLNELVATLRKNKERQDLELSQLSKQSSKYSDLENDVILKKSQLTIVHLKLIEKYFKSQKTKNMFAKLNENEKYNDYFDQLSSDTGKFLLTTFLSSAIGKPLPAVVSNRALKNAIDKQIKNIEL